MKRKIPTLREAVDSSNSIFVELMTAKGKVFSGIVAAVEFSTAAVVVQIESGSVSYLGLINSGELILRAEKKFRFFALFRATASVMKRRLTVLAEVIEPVAAPSRNCGNPACKCDGGILDSSAAFRRETQFNQQQPLANSWITHFWRDD